MTMEPKPTEEGGHLALRDHVVAKANMARLRYGPRIDADAIAKVLDDREIMRFPTRISFDASALQPGEFAHAQSLGEHPKDGFCLFIHPLFEHRPDTLPLLIAYHIVDINYGEIATADEAELFGATLLGLDVDSYYDALCELVDSIPPDSYGRQSSA